MCGVNGSILVSKTNGLGSNPSTSARNIKRDIKYPFSNYNEEIYFLANSDAILPSNASPKWAFKSFIISPILY